MMNNKLLFHVSAEDFKKIPGSPIAYWISPAIITAYNNKTLDRYADVRHGLSTGKNELFVRLWFEVNNNKINFSSSSREMAAKSHARYFPYNKGGSFRKWYGNADCIVWYDISGQETMKSLSGHRHDGKERYFQEGLTWSFISSSHFGVRYTPLGFVFDVAGSSLFAEHNTLIYLVGLLCSKLGPFFMSIQNPTLNFQVGNLRNIAVVISNEKMIQSIVNSAITIEEKDWDSYETSWGFQESPLIEANGHSNHLGKLSVVYGHLRAIWEQQCETMRKLEVENNRVFIDTYGLQDELSPDVPWDEITLTCNPWYRYGKTPELEPDGQHFSSEGEVKVGTIFGMQPTGIKVSTPNPDMKVTSFPFNQELEDRLQKDTIKELISYAVGCMFGRYSLDRPGLAFAGGAWDPSLDTTFPPDADNVIPILDEDWFADDIVGRFQEFLKVAFGEENYHENLAFVEAALGKDIRSYFTKDFYADHVKMYQKRPIYWLFSSPTGAFSALVYLHRYRQDTVGTVLTYLRSHITKVNAHIQEQEEIIASAKASASMKSRAVRERLKMQHELQELEDYERDVLYPLSTERLEIDLDDGVKVNYPKFGKALRPVKGLDAKEE